MALRTSKYRRHKGSGQALVQINGQRIYLGKYGSEQSEERYRRLVARHLQSNEAPPPPSASAADLTVNEFIVAYWRFAEGYYVKDGRPTGEHHNIRDALRPLQHAYGSSAINDFRANDLKAVRAAMIDADLSRSVINGRVNRIRRAFKWGVVNDFVEPAVLQRLQAVEPLKRGRTKARESAPVKPVADEHVDAVRPYVSRQVWAMVQLQRLTGMRSGEVTIMRGCDLDMTGSLWLYEPQSHKTDHHGHKRIVEFGPQAQAVIRPFLKRDVHAYLFQPGEAMAERHARQRKNRKTSVPPCQQRRAMESKRRPRKRSPRDRYSSHSHGRAIAKACKRAGIPHWHPHQLRHTFATRIRKDYGLEVARVLLGHRAVAARIMSAVG